jgi:hypothetical protein
MRHFISILILLSLCSAASAQQGDKIWVGSKMIFNFQNDSLEIDTLLSDEYLNFQLLVNDCHGAVLGGTYNLFRNDSMTTFSNQFYAQHPINTCASTYDVQYFSLTAFLSPIQDNSIVRLSVSRNLPNDYAFSFSSWHIANDSMLLDSISCNTITDNIPTPLSYYGTANIRAGKSYWHLYNTTNDVLAFEILNSGINQYKRTTRNGTSQTSYFGSAGNAIQANNTGTQIATIEDDGTNVLNLYDFNKITGSVTYSKPLLTKAQLPNYNFCSGAYESVLDGLAFSESDSLIYVAYTYSPICNDPYKLIRNIYQIDRFHPNPSSTARVVFSKFYSTMNAQPSIVRFTSIFTGPDGIVYWSENHGTHTHTIANANVYNGEQHTYNRYSLPGNINNEGITTSPSAYMRASFDAFSSCADSTLAVYYGSQYMQRVAYHWGDGDSTVYDSGTIANGDQSLHAYDSSGTYSITQKSIFNNCGYGKTKSKDINVTVPPMSTNYTLVADTSCTEHTVMLIDTVEHTETIYLDWGDGQKDTLGLATNGLNPISISHTYATEDTFSLNYRLVGYGIFSEGIAGCTQVIDSNYIAAFHPTPQPDYTWSTNYITNAPLSDTLLLCVNEGLSLKQSNDSLVYFTSSSTIGLDTSIVDNILLQLPSGWHQTILKSYTTDGCPASDTLTIGVAPRSTALWQGDTNVCENSTTTHGIKALTSLGTIDSLISSTPIIYKSADSLLLALNGSTVYAHIITSTAYSDVGCIDTFGRAVHIRPLPTLSLLGDSAACVDALLLYSPTVVSMDSSILDWSVNGVSLLTTALVPQDDHIDYNTIINTPKRIELGALVSTKYGCTDSDTVYTEVYAPPVISLSEAEINACLNEQPITLTSNTTIYEPTDIMHSWNDGTTSSTLSAKDTIEHHQHRYVSPGNYTFTSTAFGQVSKCTDTSSNDITIYGIPKVSISGDDACEDAQGTVLTTWKSDTTLATVKTFADIVLLNTITQPSEQGSSEVYYLPSANSTTLLNIVRDTLGCADSSMITTRTLAKPAANYTANYGSAEEFRVSYLFADKSLNHTSAELYYGDGFSDVLSPNFTQEYRYADTGTFSSYLIISNEGLCFDTAYQSILALPFVDFYIPTSITPNADGLNDYLNFSTTFIQSLQIEVYNRWGENVMRIGDVTELEKTKSLPIGVYAVSYTIVDIFYNKHYLHQTLTVLK